MDPTTLPPAEHPQTFTYWTIRTRFPVTHPRHGGLTCTLRLDPTQGFDVDTTFDSPGIGIVSEGPYRGTVAALVIPWSNVVEALVEETQHYRSNWEQG